MSVLLDAFILGCLLLSVLLTIQSAYTLYLMLYTWDRPEAYQRAKAPDRFVPPQKAFTVMLPARHEEDVIQMTIERLVRSSYPRHLVGAILSGAAFGVAVLTKENAMFFAPVLVYQLARRLQHRMNVRFSIAFWLFTASSTISLYFLYAKNELLPSGLTLKSTCRRPPARSNIRVITPTR